METESQRERAEEKETDILALLDVQMQFLTERPILPNSRSDVNVAFFVVVVVAVVCFLISFFIRKKKYFYFSFECILFTKDNRLWLQSLYLIHYTLYNLYSGLCFVQQKCL